MATKYTNLDELRSEKRLLKQEIGELEDILTFKSKKESLSVITNGLTDKFLKETEDEEGEKSLSLDTQNIMREISAGMKETASKKNILNLANDGVKSGLALVYLAPYALRFIREKLDEYQKNKTASSLEKLI